MKNKESSYFKIFRQTMIIIVSVAIIVGAVTISVCAAAFEKSQLSELKQTGELFVKVFSGAYRNAADDESIQSLSNEFEIFKTTRMYVYDKNGNSVISADNSAESKKLDPSMMTSLDKSDYLSSNATSVSLNEPELMYGSKFSAVNADGESEYFYITAYDSTDEKDIFVLKVTITYIIMSLAAVFGCYFVLKRKAKDHMDYEANFLRITEQYIKGDFSEKLSTDLSPYLRHISDLVNTLASHVEKSDETSSTFIANVSHELRTPMTTIGGFVDGILDGTIKKSSHQEYLILVSQEIQRLRILITSMLNMSRYESGTLIPNFTKTNLTDLVIKVMLMFEKRIEEKELNIEELDSSRLTAIVDPDLMQQVVYNLVENAVKFVNKGGTLSFVFDKRDGVCIVGIRNTGEGLKDTEIQQVFDRFYKTDSSRGKDKTGLGLGLSISRKIVHLHKGHIVVKSVYGEYTEFQIQIPEDPTKTDSIKKI